MKKFFLVFLALTMFLFSACGAVDEEQESELAPNGEGLAPPMIFVNDRIYIVHPNVRDGRTILDDSFVYIGKIQSINAHRHGVLVEPKNFQSNGGAPVGSRMYQSGDNIVVVFPEGIEGVIGGYHLPMRYIGVRDSKNFFADNFCLYAEKLTKQYEKLLREVME